MRILRKLKIKPKDFRNYKRKNQKLNNYPPVSNIAREQIQHLQNCKKSTKTFTQKFTY